MNCSLNLLIYVTRRKLNLSSRLQESSGGCGAYLDMLIMYSINHVKLSYYYRGRQAHHCEIIYLAQDGKKTCDVDVGIARSSCTSTLGQFSEFNSYRNMCTVLVLNPSLVVMLLMFIHPFVSRGWYVCIHMFRLPNA